MPIRDQKTHSTMHLLKINDMYLICIKKMIASQLNATKLILLIISKNVDIKLNFYTILTLIY